MWVKRSCVLRDRHGVWVYCKQCPRVQQTELTRRVKKSCCQRATRPQMTKSQLNKARRVLCISKVHEEFKAEGATCIPLQSMLGVFRQGWTQELRPRGRNPAHLRLLALFSCVGFILGLQVVALSKFRLASSMLLSVSPEIASPLYRSQCSLPGTTWVVVRSWTNHGIQGNGMMHREPVSRSPAPCWISGTEWAPAKVTDGGSGYRRSSMSLGSSPNKPRA